MNDDCIFCKIVNQESPSFCIWEDDEEGYGVNHLHMKLYPLHGTQQTVWKPILANQPYVFKKYEGYLSTQDGPPADFDQLKLLAERIRNRTPKHVIPTR